MVLVVRAGRKLRWRSPIAVAFTWGFHGGRMDEFDLKLSCSVAAELGILFVDALPVVG